MPVGQIIWSIIGIIVIIVAAYFTTYIIAARSTRNVSGGGIKLRDNFVFSKDKSVCAVEISNRVYILAMSQGAITLLDTRDADEYNAERSSSRPASPVSIEAFKNTAVFSKFMEIAHRKPGVSSAENRSTPDTAREEDDLDIISQKIAMRRKLTNSDSGNKDEYNDRGER